MPLTPFHLGSGLLLGVLIKRINLWAILLGSVVMDLEPLYLIFIKRCYNCYHHGFWHSISGAILGSLIIAVVLWAFRNALSRISLKFGINQLFAFPTLFFSSLLGWLIHIFIDSLTHYDVFLLWPLEKNLILIGPQIYWPLNYILLVLGIIGSILFYRRFKNKLKI